MFLGGWKVVAAGASHGGLSATRQLASSGFLSSHSPAFGFVSSVVAAPVAPAASLAVTGDAPAASPPGHDSPSPGGDWVLAPDHLPVPAESGDVPPLPVAHSASDPGFHPVRVLRTQAGAATVTLTCWNPAAGRTERIVGRRGRDTVFALSNPASLHLPTRAVQDVRTGDLVASRDPKTGQATFGRVVGTRTRMAPVLVTVGLKDKATGQTEALTCTPEHPLYVRDKGWVAAGALAQGSQIVTRAGPTLMVQGLGWTRAGETTSGSGVQTSGGGTQVYNFEVSGTHAYFVGTQGGGVLAHNTICRGTFRKSAIAKAEQEAPRNQAGDMICPTCGQNIPDKIIRNTINGPVERRGYDLDHYPDTWAERVQAMEQESQLPSRAAQLNEYNRDLRVQCPTCNQGHQWEGIKGPYQ